MSVVLRSAKDPHHIQWGVKLAIVINRTEFPGFRIVPTD